MSYRRLKENLFLEIPYPEDVTELIGNGAPWRKFCALPADVKKKFKHLKPSHDHETGYQLRSKAAGREDKELFHFYPNYKEQLKRGGLEGLVQQTPALQSFFEYAAEVHQAVITFSEEISRNIGKDVPQLLQLLNAGELQFLLRFLHYTSEEDSIIAAPHFDRSIYTLHLYENAPGLQLLDWNMEWKDAPIREGATVLFSGYRLEAMTSGEIQKTWHRVVDSGNNRGRISMVLFLWSPRISDYPKEARAQDQTPSYQRVGTL